MGERSLGFSKQAPAIRYFRRSCGSVDPETNSDRSETPPSHRDMIIAASGSSGSGDVNLQPAGLDVLADRVLDAGDSGFVCP